MSKSASNPASVWRNILILSAGVWLASGAETPLESIDLTISTEGLKRLEAAPNGNVLVVVQWQGKRITNCTAHVKGHGSFRPISELPSFSIHSSKQVFFGRKRLLLNNSSQDPSFLKWKIASELFAKAGVPSPEVSFARVSLNGKSLGLYLMLEPTDKEFLKKHFSDDSGNLYEGDNQDVTDRLDKDNGEGDEAQTDRQRLAASCLEPDLKERWSKVNETLDVNRFLSFMAVEVIVDHRDGYSMDRNNFRLYHNPVDGKFVFIPHGLDLLFYNAGLNPSRRFSSIVASSLLATPEGRNGYEKRVHELAVNFFSNATVLKRIDELWDQIKNAAPPQTVKAVAQLKTAIKLRIEFVQQQH